MTLCGSVVHNLCLSVSLPCLAYKRVHKWVSFGRDLFRLDVASKPWKKDDQQSVEHVPSGSSPPVHGQLHLLARLWLVQLPCCWQDVPVQHTRHSADRQLDRHCRRQRLGLVQQQLHGPCLNSIALLARANYITSYITLDQLSLHVWSFIFCVNSSVAFSLKNERKLNLFPMHAVTANRANRGWHAYLVSKCWYFMQWCICAQELYRVQLHVFSLRVLWTRVNQFNFFQSIFIDERVKTTTDIVTKISTN